MATGTELLDRLARVSAAERSELLIKGPEVGMAEVRELRAKAVDDFALFFSRLIDPALRGSARPATVEIARTEETYVDKMVVDGKVGTRLGAAISRVALVGHGRALSYVEVVHLSTLAQPVPVQEVDVAHIFRSVQARYGGGYPDTKRLGTERYTVDPVGVDGASTLTPEVYKAAIFGTFDLQAELADLRNDAANEALNPELVKYLSAVTG